MKYWIPHTMLAANAVFKLYKRQRERETHFRGSNHRFRILSSIRRVSDRAGDILLAVFGARDLIRSS